MKSEIYTFLVESDSENGINIEKLSGLIVNHIADIVQEWVDHRVPASEYPCEIRKLNSKRCIVKLCTNHSHEGRFIGDLCSPCYEYIADGKGVNSQAYRNSVVKTRDKILENLKQIT